MFQQLRASLILIVLFTLITGIAYPMLITNIGQLLFPHQANGSLVEQNGKIIGSELIGQNFTRDKYFHPRPSAAGNGYDAENSSGSNLAPSSPNLIKTVTARVTELQKLSLSGPIPIDMVTASASGLDPDISVASAYLQAPRIALARNLSLQQIQSIVAQNTIPRLFGVWGENHVNVLQINQILDTLAPVTP